MFQLNAGSIEGKFGETVKKTATTFLDRKIYNFIGSDAHDIKNRNTGIEAAIALISDKIVRDIFGDSSGKLLQNKPVEFLGQKIQEKRSIFSFFKR